MIDLEYTYISFAMLHAGNILIYFYRGKSITAKHSALFYLEISFFEILERA